MSTDNDDLTPGLQALADALSESRERMPTKARLAARRRILRAVRSDTRWGAQRAAFVRAAAVFTAGVTLMGTMSFAAARSLPGDWLYDVKRGSENMVVAVLPDGALERSVLVRIAERRAEEVSRIASDDGGEDRVGPALERFRIAVRDMLGANGADGGDAVEAELRLLGRIREMNREVQERLEAVVSDVAGEQMNGTSPDGSGAPSGGSTEPPESGGPQAPDSPSSPSGPGPGDGGSGGTQGDDSGQPAPSGSGESSGTPQKKP
ncbi:MAG: DUF5667 domain-containing protein [Coriobacteriia bacterium]